MPPRAAGGRALDAVGCSGWAVASLAGSSRSGSRLRTTWPSHEPASSDVMMASITREAKNSWLMMPAA